MSHALEKRDGKTSFAYDRFNGAPWHKLGTPFDGKQDLDTMLVEVGADFIAYAAPAMADGHIGVATSDRHIAICAERPRVVGSDDKGNPITKLETQIFAFMGAGYEIVQYRHVAERAANVVGESDESAIFDAMGLLYEGNQFFATLALDGLVIDPRGINDEILPYLVIRSSHDGSYAITFVNSIIRAVCKNTVDFAMSGATRKLSARHTANVDKKIVKEEAQAVLGFSTEWADAFTAVAEKMLAVPFTPTFWDRTIEHVFSMPTNPTPTQEGNVTRARESVRRTFESDTNAGNFGKSGWTMYNAIVEYLDHYRPGGVENLALASMTPGTSVDQKKTKAARYILAAKNN